MLQFNQKYIEEHNRVELTDCAAIKLLLTWFSYYLKRSRVAMLFLHQTTID